MRQASLMSRSRLATAEQSRLGLLTDIWFGFRGRLWRRPPSFAQEDLYSCDLKDRCLTASGAAEIFRIFPQVCL